MSLAVIAEQPVPKSSEIHDHLTSAEAALRAKDPAAATREFRAVLRLDPNNSEAHANLGILEFAQGDCPAASVDLSRALAEKPSLAQAQALLGLCATRTGDPAARKLLEASFASVRDLKLRTRVGMELVRIDSAEGSVERAVLVAQKLIELDPENPDVLYAAQRLYNDLADTTLNKLAIVAPGSARMQQVIAERLINAGDLESAIVHYRKALELDSQLSGVRYELAEAILQTSHLNPQTQADAKRTIEEAQQSDGDSANLECLLGNIAFLREDMSEANLAYRRALSLNPRDSEALLGLGRVLMAMDKLRDARKYLLLAIDSDPLNSVAHYRLAMADRKLGLEEEARKEALVSKEVKTTLDNVERLYVQMHKHSVSQREQEELENTNHETVP